MKLAAVDGVGAVYTSTNGGASWAYNVTPVAITRSLVSSSDGGRLAAIGSDGSIYVSQTLPPTPDFERAFTDGSQFAFSWTAISNQVYQLQFETDLTGSNWVDLGIPILATNRVMNAAVPVGPDPQRFYRVQLVQ